MLRYSKFLVSLCLTAVVPYSADQPREQGAGPLRNCGPPLSSRPSVEADLAKLPLSFIPNQGQSDPRVVFYVPGRDQTMFFTDEGVTFDLTMPRDASKDGNPQSDAGFTRYAVKMDFLDGARRVRPEGRRPGGPTFSFFRGKPEEWIRGLAAFSEIVYPDLWPGIDLVFLGDFRKLKYEFVVHPGADPSKIRMAYRGATSVSVGPMGDLEIDTPAGTIRDAAPVAYQEIGGERTSVTMSYRLGRDGTYGFEVGSYDPDRALILDPVVIVYCGFIGGSGTDEACGIAVDASGYAYVTGVAYSSPATFPETVGPGLSYAGSGDAFVAKIDPAGNSLVYCGYIGGASWDIGYGIGVDGSGNAYIAGFTQSPQATFPVSIGPDSTYGGNGDGFVAKIDASGTFLAFCGYIGGTGSDKCADIAVDTSGYAYVVGDTYSDQTTFPVLTGPDLIHNGGSDAFVAKVDAGGSVLDYCGYIGGSSTDAGKGIAIDGAGNAYLTGNTYSGAATFPVAIGPSLIHSGANEAFVAKVNAGGASLAYCGYIGGAGNDDGWGIAVDGTGKAYVSGYTESSPPTFPVIQGPDLIYNGAGDAFVAKVEASGASLIYCGYIGGAASDMSYAGAVDAGGNFYVAGITYSNETTFPVVIGPGTDYQGGGDAFVAKINPSGEAILYCGYLGGWFFEYAESIAADTAGNVYIAGPTQSDQTTFPVTQGPDLSYNGAQDAFLAKISGAAKDDLLGTWDGQGVYYRDSGTGQWGVLATPADMIVCGDLEGDGIDDLIGIWASQAGVWARDSADGGWAYVSSSAVHIAAGDMNGDGRTDFLGTWDGQGVYYRDSVSGLWTLMATPATLITAGDLDGDTEADLIGIWPTQAGVWVKSSLTGDWEYLGSSARDMTTGDMNGDGRADLVGTWDGQGVYFKDSVSSQWTQIATPADQIAAGDLDGDGKDDLIGIWAGQAGVWVKFSETQTWSFVGSSARDIAAGKIAGGTWSNGLTAFGSLATPMGGRPIGPAGLRFADRSAEAPGGNAFTPQAEGNLTPSAALRSRERVPGPGEPGFACVRQENLSPRSSRLKAEK